MLLRKGIYPHEYMDGWEKCNEKSFTKMEEFYSNLNLENIADSEKISNDFEIKTSGEHNDLYLKSNVLSLLDIFENVRKMYLEIYELDPARFLSATGLGWQAAWKKTKIKLELLTHFDILLMVVNGTLFY